MAVAIIRDPLSGKTFSGEPGLRMYLYSETGSVSLGLPLAPRMISYGGMGREWVETERSGTTPLLLPKAQKLETLGFSFMLTSRYSMYAAQSSEITALRSLVTTGERVLVRYGPQEAGLWRITECTVDSELRHPGTNEVTRAVATVSLKKANDAAPSVGPVSGGSKPVTTPPNPAPQRTHTVVKGNTLWGLAQKYYGQGVLWPRIFDANRSKIKDPHWIYPGQVFVIP